MIDFQNLTVRRDGRILFQNASLQIHPSQKVGVTGNNGTGKSTLFAVLLGKHDVDSGSVTMPDGWHIAHMAQEVAGTSQTALDYVLSGDAEWFELNAKLHDSDATNAIETSELAKLHERFDDIDGYRTPAKASQIMAGLGFANAQFDEPVSGFSGGWRMRLNLAKTLMSRADLLLLDEPTNHLDLDAILWLEDWITRFDGTLLLISHDERFLDATVGHILHIENQSMTLYTGNYSQFIRTRSQRLAQQEQAYAKQQATKAHLEDFVRRFRAKATKAKQAQSRLKQLERMADIAPVMADNPFSFSFYEPTQLPSPLITLENASVGYDGAPLLDNIGLQITPDTRLGLLGMNGAGKSTLIKALVGELPLISGTRKTAEGLQLGYFNQHQMDSLDGDASPMLMLRRLAGTTSDATLRAFLGSFDFRGERIDTPSASFSGGERARLTLALIVWQRPNVLVLDEPTNHLDLQMRQALMMALQQFDGAVVLVSHDRKLIAGVCDELMLVHDGRAEEFKGDISDYGKWLSDNRLSATKSAPTSSLPLESSEQIDPSKLGKPNNDTADKNLSATSGTTHNTTHISLLSKDELRRRKAEQRKLTAPIRKRIDTAEQTLEKLSTKLEDLENKLTDTSLYEDANKDKLLKLLDEQSTLQSDHAEQEMALLEAMEELEAKEAEFDSSFQ